jgi:hypothetical protein
MCDDANAKQEWIQSLSIDYIKLLKRRKNGGIKILHFTKNNNNGKYF